MWNNQEGIHIKFQGDWIPGILGLSVLPLCHSENLVFACLWEWVVVVGLYVPAAAQKELSAGFKTAKP